MARSLRLRLIVWILAVLLPVSVAAGWLLVQVFGDRMLRDIDVALEEEAETVAAMLEQSASDNTMATVLAHVSGETDLGPGKRIVVRRGSRVIGAAPADAETVLTAPPQPALRTVRHESGPPENRLQIVIGVPATAALRATQRLTLLLAAGIPCGLVVLTAGLWVVIGRALRPLAQASQRMEAIGIGDLDARVPVAHPEDEVGRMVLALNRMLDRLADAVGELRRFTADAAHELRTPLAVLRAGLEVTLARDRSSADYHAALADALKSTERLSELAEDLLTLARLEARAAVPASAPVDMVELLHDLADAWHPRAAQHELTIGVQADPPLAVPGASADLYRLFNNLIDNALRHSPRGGRVQVEARRNGAGLTISVADDGPGIADDEAERVFDRFYRGRHEHDGGTGLGLSIAHAIVRAHDGSIRLANRAGGGCAATVWLPHAVPAS
jgi:signal transduction histidine kinase